MALPQKLPEVLGILCNPSSLSPSRRVARAFHLLQLRACGNLTCDSTRRSAKTASRAATVRERSQPRSRPRCHSLFHPVTGGRADLWLLLLEPAL